MHKNTFLTVAMHTALKLVTSAIVVKHDKITARDRELSKSCNFPSHRTTVIADTSYLKDSKNNAVNYVIDCKHWDVQIVHNRQVLQLPSDLLPGLVYYNCLWQDGVGKVPKPLYELILQHIHADLETPSAQVKQSRC